MKIQKNKIKSGERLAVTVLALPKTVFEKWDPENRCYVPSCDDKDKRHLLLVYDYEPNYGRDAVYFLNVTPKLFGQLDDLKVGSTYVIQSKPASFTVNDRLISYIKYDVTRPINSIVDIEDIEDIYKIYKRYADTAHENIYDYYRKLANIEEWSQIKESDEYPF